MILKLKRTPGLYLVGFMACGKTTIGGLVAERLGWSFVDIDAIIETEQKAAISEIFDRYGEQYFRELETQALRERVRLVQAGRPMVIAVGGGAFAQPVNFDLVQNNGVSVWLDCPLDVLWERARQQGSRPLARDRHKFEELYYGRLEIYARADYRVDITSDDPVVAAEAIFRLPIF